MVGHDGALRVVSIDNDLGSSRQVRTSAVGQLALSSVVPFPGSTGGGDGGGDGGDRLVAVGSWDCNLYVVSLEYGRVVQVSFASIVGVFCLYSRSPLPL